jgi:DNA-binding transcriptional LysR family regulator
MNSGLLEHLQVFAAVAQAGSITGASIALNVGQTTISRQVAALEKHLGCRLFQRSTRAISLTEDGEMYLRHALRMLELNDETEAAIQNRDAGLRGRLRIACSNGFGRKLLIPTLADWQSQHPQVHVELVMSDRLSQLIEDRVDVAFRTAPLAQSGLVSRTIGHSQRIVVASSTYLRRHGAVKEPSQLRDHQCILFAAAQRPGFWEFEGPDGKTSVQVKGRLTLSTVDALQDAVLAGLGVAIMPTWFWSRGNLGSEVIQLLPEYNLPKQPINALTSTRHPKHSKVRKFVDHMENALLQLHSR